MTGLVLAPFHLALLTLIPLGIAAAVIAPGRIRQKELFRVNTEPEECLITPIANVTTRSLVRIDARYETSGWEGRTNVTGSLTNGTEYPLLDIPGTEESLAKAVCEQLARLCRCPVEYTGPFGESVRFEEGQV